MGALVCGTCAREPVFLPQIGPECLRYFFRQGKGIEHNGPLVQQELLIRLQVAQEVLNESAAGVARKKIQGRNA